MTGTVPNHSTNNPKTKSTARIPKTIVATNREEFIEPEELTVIDRNGKQVNLPLDLHGHYFLVSPAGLENSVPLDNSPGKTVWVTQDGWTPIYNGDGLIYRFSFQQGKAKLKSRLAKPPCYFAELATLEEDSQFKDLAFTRMGIACNSFRKLGSRNQLNTNFVPFRLPNEDSDRLLITWDVGRPYEIDPETLETLTPVGKNQDWIELFPNQPPQPFKTLMTSAHPVYDTCTGEFFTLNVGKSLSTILGFDRALKERLAEINEALDNIKKDSEFSNNGLRNNLLQGSKVLLSILMWVFQAFNKLEQFIRKFRGGYDFVHLLCWDGKKVNIDKTWNIVLSGDRPIRIDQTVHQMGITKDYIVFAESSFKFSLENIISFKPKTLLRSLQIFLADCISYPQYPSTKVYIVKRADLENAQQQPQPKHIFNKLFPIYSGRNAPKVIAKEIELAPEFSHFLVDYENPNNQITLYISHLAATDIAEYVHVFNRSAFDDRDKNYDHQDPDLTARLQELSGNITGPMDINRLGRWVINGETGEIVQKQQFPDESDRETIKEQIECNSLEVKYQFTWSTAFCVHQDQRPTNKITDIFWNSWGCWPDNLNQRIIESSKRYPNRLVDFDQVKQLSYQGLPSSICHMEIRSDENNQTVAKISEQNYFQFPHNHLGSSAHFIPRPKAKNQTDGYIVCIVLTSDQMISQSKQSHNDPQWSQNNEIWIFDAAKLNEGPIYKMSHPRLNIGFAFHTTWLPEVKSPTKKLEYCVKEDHEYILDKIIKKRPDLGHKIRRLFEEKIYPNYK